MTDPNGRVVYRTILAPPAAGQFLLNSYPAVRRPGRYTFEFRPINQGQLTLKLRFRNANREPAQVLTNGSSVSMSFPSAARYYRKFRIPLAKGQLVSMARPATQVKMTVLDGLSRIVQDQRGLAFRYLAETDGDYFLFIYREDGVSGSYSSVVSITNP